MATSRPTVLIVDDNDMMRKLLIAEFTTDGRFEVDSAATGAEALEKASNPNCAAIILDMMLPDTDGVAVIEQLKSMRTDLPSVIAITGAPQAAIPDSIIEAPYRGLVSAVFRKPFDRAKLVETVAFCLDMAPAG